MHTLPNEIINIIISYMQRPDHVKIMKVMIVDYYENDYDPFWLEIWRGKYAFEYSFQYWYFVYRNQMKYLFKQKNKYYHTPAKLIIGDERLYHTNL